MDVNFFRKSLCTMKRLTQRNQSARSDGCNFASVGLPEEDREVSASSEPGHRQEECGPFSQARLRSDGWNLYFVVLPTWSFPCPMILLKLAEGTRLLFFDETSQPKSVLTESLYTRFVNDFKDDYLVREYDHGDFRRRYATGLTAVQDSAPSFFPLTRRIPFH
jgi:hypothetical protein